MRLYFSLLLILKFNFLIAQVRCNIGENYPNENYEYFHLQNFLGNSNINYRAKLYNIPNDENRLLNPQKINIKECSINSFHYLQIEKENLTDYWKKYGINGKLFLEFGFEENKFINLQIVKDSSNGQFFILKYGCPEVLKDIFIDNGLSFPAQFSEKYIYYFKRIKVGKYAFFRFDIKSKKQTEIFDFNLDSSKSINFFKILGSQIFFGGFNNNKSVWTDSHQIGRRGK